MSGTGIDFFRKALEKTKKGSYEKAIKILDDTIEKTFPIYSVSNNNSFTISEWEFIDEITYCEKKVTSKNNNYKGYLTLSLLYKAAGNHDRRKQYLQQALKIDNTVQRLWREYGETNFHLGNIRLALQNFQEALTLKSNCIVSLEGIGLCYYYLDEPFKSLSPLEKALKIDSDNHILMNHIAFILSEIGEVNKASKIILKALELAPENVIYLDTYASILFLQEKYNESLKVFEKILNNKPKDWEVSWDILTNVYENLGLHVKAKQIEEKLQLQ